MHVRFIFLETKIISPYERLHFIIVNENAEVVIAPFLPRSLTFRFINKQRFYIVKVLIISSRKTVRGRNFCPGNGINYLFKFLPSE